MRIKEKRIEMGLTQMQFSNIFGVPLSTVKKWDSDVMYPPVWAEKLILEKLEQMQKEKEI